MPRSRLLLSAWTGYDRVSGTVHEVDVGQRLGPAVFSLSTYHGSVKQRRPADPFEQGSSLAAVFVLP